MAHGILLILLIASALIIPALSQWPWMWVAPLGAYFLFVLAVPRLRQGVTWLEVGRTSGVTIATTIALMVCTVLVLLAFNRMTPPNSIETRVALPTEAFGNVFIFGVIFTAMNPILEELVFRGVFFDSIGSQWGPRVTVVATALLFGIGHLHGYPSGLVGASLATVFGIALGGLRFWTGGLLLPIVAHMAADATICCILVRVAAKTTEVGVIPT